mmetsp:Transcript_24594/g.63894  ORF Transcript_24594/g.63894 Transcript_24594/m.63894 type:complete len:200 (-) Transcript_24594:358-957(-)
MCNPFRLGRSANFRTADRLLRAAPRPLGACLSPPPSPAPPRATATVAARPCSAWAGPHFARPGQGCARLRAGASLLPAAAARVSSLRPPARAWAAVPSRPVPPISRSRKNRSSSSSSSSGRPAWATCRPTAWMAAWGAPSSRAKAASTRATTRSSPWACRSRAKARAATRRCWAATPARPAPSRAPAACLAWGWARACR